MENRRPERKRYIIGRSTLDDVTWLCVRAAFLDRALYIRIRGRRDPIGKANLGSLFSQIWCVGSWGPSASAANLLASKYSSWLFLCCKHAVLCFGLLRGEDDECSRAHCERKGKGIAGCKGNSMYRVLKKTPRYPTRNCSMLCVILWELLKGVGAAMQGVMWCGIDI